jgi:hypothetical protein
VILTKIILRLAPSTLELFRFDGIETNARPLI